jgi:hypothetical protein
MTPDLISHRLGTVTLDPPGSIVAGSVGTWILTYTVGSYGLDEGATLKLSQRFASDWEIPQFDRPTDSGYTTVQTNGAAKLRPYYHAKAHERPWMKCLVIDLYDGSLAPGDIITITLGDRSHGSPGIRAQTFQESAHEFRLLVDPTNASVVRRLPTSPLFPVVPGEPVELVCIIPTQAVIGEPFEVFVKGQDCWGNPVIVTDPTLTWQGDAASSLHGTVLTLTTSGSGYLIAETTINGVKLTCHSNPTTDYTNRPPLQRYWGDLHAQTDATVGTGTEVEYFTFGRDVARLDFTSHQGNDFQMTDADWQRLNQVVQEFHEDGRFVVFPGYEWSANTTAGGDRNVIYRSGGKPILRSSHWQIPDTPEDDLTPAHPTDVLFAKLRQQVDPADVLLAAHVGGRYADIRRYFDQDLSPLVEIVSCWGVFEWLLWDAFEMGYIVGIMCNSDGHKGRPGAEGPGAGEFGIANGLTCVLAESHTRNAIFDALKNRRCYGTTGPRIDLDFTVNGQPMGSVIEADGPLQTAANVRGTAPIESLTLFQGKDAIQQVQPAAFANCDGSRRIRLRWSGSRIRGRGRRVTWDGTIRVVGATILGATPFQFDAATDGITGHSAQEVSFKSSTTGDTDGIDLVLDQASSGTIIFTSPVVEQRIDLADLIGEKRVVRVACGGVDMALVIERYPQDVTEMATSLECTVDAPTGQMTPYFVKAIQVDGHIAWASPVYVR